MFLGEVFRPDDVVGRKRKSSDLSPGFRGITPTSLQDVIREVKLLKAEVKKIKQVLRANGIVVNRDL